ncbi:MAG: sugar phosphate isomerase/epimerase family protein [Bacteroidota bacterium]
MYDLGFVSAIFAEKSFEEVIDFASENQFQCVEMMCWPKGKAERRYAGVTHIDVDNLDENSIEKIQTYLKKKEVYISALGYYPNPMDADIEKREIYIEHIKKVISAAQSLKIPVVNTFIGRSQLATLEENFTLFTKLWPPIIAHAENCHVKVGIENCPMFFTQDEWPNGKNMAISPQIWDRLFAIADSENLGLNYDPSHAIWQQMDYISHIKDYSKKLFHVHLKDAKLHREKLEKVGILATPLEYHTPKLSGRGEVDWALFFENLKNHGYQGPVVIEFEDKEFEKSEEKIIEGLLATRDYVQKYL